LDWVTKKYGKEKVAHIITYGTMAAKSAIADVGRVQKVPLPEVNKIKGFIPDRNFDEAAVKAELLKRLAKYKVPSFFIVYDRLPMLGSGKIDGVALKKDALEKLAAKR
jgi:DNA polymerase III alpha subunit